MHQNVKELACLSRVFEEQGINGCAVFLPHENGAPFAFNCRSVFVRHSPASTFKILNSLIALELGILSIEDTLPYDGTPTWNEAWKRPFTIGQAFKASAVWFYQKLARDIGLTTYRRYFEDISYGNMDCGSTVDTFWLDGTLRISAFEQAQFVMRLFEGKLPFRPETLKHVVSFMTLTSSLSGDLRGKTGWTDTESPKYGWFVGCYSACEYKTSFATLIEMPVIDFAPKRQEVTELSLEACLRQNQFLSVQHNIEQ